MRISICIEQACSGSDQGSGTIEIHTSTFHDDAGMIDRDSISLSNERRNHIIKIKRWIFSTPCIMSPVYNDFRLSTVGIDQEGWSVVPAPGIIGWMMKKTYAL